MKLKTSFLILLIFTMNFCVFGTCLAEEIATSQKNPVGKQVFAKSDISKRINNKHIYDRKKVEKDSGDFLWIIENQNKDNNETK